MNTSAAGALLTARSKRDSGDLPSLRGISTTSGGSSAWLTASDCLVFDLAAAALSSSLRALS
jgi:hypothetical protein